MRRRWCRALQETVIQSTTISNITLSLDQFSHFTHCVQKIMLLLSLPSACWKSGASKNRDLSQNALIFHCYFAVIWCVYYGVFFDEFFDKFFDDYYLTTIFLTKSFDRFS